MTSGEQRLPERLQDKLDADYLHWYNVPVGPTRALPDFRILHHALEPHRVLCKDEMWENVGIQAQGRTTILKINYRNTKQILQTASLVAAECSSPHTPSASKGLEFPVVALPGVGHMPAPGEDEKEAARVLYVAATRATQRLVVGVGGDGGFGSRLGS